MDAMTGVARYIIVLDRYDDDDYAAAQMPEGGHDGSAQAACEQVAGELQEAMEQHGTPAGFFNVIDRRILPHPQTNVSTVDPASVAEQIGLERKMQDDPA
jgi:hypothetical protein